MTHAHWEGEQEGEGESRTLAKFRLCDDCVTYHLIRCREEGITRGQIFETLSIAFTVGGSIVIPHLRRGAVDGAGGRAYVRVATREWLRGTSLPEPRPRRRP